MRKIDFSTQRGLLELCAALPVILTFFGTRPQSTLSKYNFTPRNETVTQTGPDQFHGHSRELAKMPLERPRKEFVSDNFCTRNHVKQLPTLAPSSNKNSFEKFKKEKQRVAMFKRISIYLKV